MVAFEDVMPIIKNNFIRLLLLNKIVTQKNVNYFMHLIFNRKSLPHLKIMKYVLYDRRINET